ncbi:MAG: toll/interleukin-1 receptor domain-containing protein [Chitinophagales bacterium]
MKNKDKENEIYCAACGGTGLIADKNNKNRRRHCPRCGAIIRVQGFEIKVEGQVAEEVKEVTSHLFQQATAMINATEKLTNLAQDKEKETLDKWDVFISHASEDKENFVKELADILKYHGVKVWYDGFTLKVGMSLVNSIDAGLKKSKFGIVVLSNHFINKKWTDYEKRSLVTREVNGKQQILPIWHNITKDEVLEFSAFLADKVALDTSQDTTQTIVLKLLEVIRPDIYENYHRHLKYLDMIRNSKPLKAALEDLKISEIRHKELPKHQLNRIKSIHYLVGKYFTSSLEESIEDYKRDLVPEREIKIWEIIASTFSDFTNKFSVTDEVIKADIAATLLLFSIGQLPMRTHLTDDGLKELNKLWQENFHTSE